MGKAETIGNGRAEPLMLEGGNVTVLDEPTNHLDLESIEALNFALSQVEGTVIFVSHDHRLIGSLATRILEIKDGRIIDRSGPALEASA